MRVCAVAALLLSAGAASAQRPGPAIVWGEGAGVTPLAPLPPEVRAALREDGAAEIDRVGFRYWRFFLFADGFNYWTADGEYVLLAADGYVPVGPDAQPSLAAWAGGRKPLAYRLPLGLLSTLALIALIVVGVRRSSGSRAARAHTDPRYVVAFGAYTAALPADGPPTDDHRRAGLAAGVALLRDEYDVDEPTAERTLRAMAQEAEKAVSYELRAAALDHEAAGQLAEAEELFAQAAAYGEYWDATDYQFIQGCLKRVRARRTASDAGAGPPLSGE